MLGALKKLTGVAVVCGVVFSLVAPGIVHASSHTTNLTDDTTTTRSVGGTSITPDGIEQAINSPTPNLANTTAYIFYTISVIMTGTFRDTQNPGESPNLQPFNPNNLGEALAQRGMIGGLGYLMGEVISNQPASFQYYAADIAKNSRFGAQPVYAQGIGFGALSPILGTWKAFRDVAYYLLTVMFIVTGFLILIRHKISGNMAVTVQNALPRLVLTLILITFSYAIAGLVVDLMFITIYFILNIFQAQIFASETIFDAGPFFGQLTLRQLAFDTNIFVFGIRYIFSGTAYGAADAVGEVVTNAVSNIEGLGFLADGNPLASIFDWIITQIFAIVFAIALFIALFRTFFQLIMSYVGFVLNTVLSPLLLLEMTIPGRDPWRGWVRNLIGGLLPFVVCIFMILMSLALTGKNTKAGIGYANPDNPNNPGNPGESGLRLPLIFGSNIKSNAFLGILAMGFMLLLPESIKMAQDLVGAKGGPFEQYKDKAVGALKQGWQGSGLVPGAKQVLAGGAAGAGAGIAAGAVAGYAGGGALGQKLGGQRGQFAGRIVGGALGALGGGAILAPVTAPGGAILAAGGTPVVRGVKQVVSGVKPVVTGLDKAATQARDYAQRKREQLGLGADAAAAQRQSTQPILRPGEGTGAPTPSLSDTDTPSGR